MIGGAVVVRFALLLDQGLDMGGILDPIALVVAAPMAGQHLLSIDDAHPVGISQYGQSGAARPRTAKTHSYKSRNWKKAAPFAATAIGLGGASIKMTMPAMTRLSERPSLSLVGPSHPADYYSHNSAFLCLPLFFVSSVAVVRLVVCP